MSVLRNHPILAVLAITVGSVLALPSCGLVADHISREATEELAGDVQARLTAAASSTGRPTDDLALLEDVLRDVVLAEADRDNGSFDPRYAGLLDADDDGRDDDGQVEIIVREESSCVRADGQDVVVISGSCPGRESASG